LEEYWMWFMVDWYFESEWIYLALFSDQLVHRFMVQDQLSY
jgi:hypothetical protein